VWTSNIVALATMDGRVYGYGLDVCEFIRIQQSGLEIGRVRTCVFGCGIFEVGRLSSHREIVRGAREFIRWTVKTFDRRGW
jgi:hypothetical protein